MRLINTRIAIIIVMKAEYEEWLRETILDILSAGVEVQVLLVTEDATTEEILCEVEELCNDIEVGSILPVFPMGEYVDSEAILQAIPLEKYIGGRYVDNE